jgi:GntR family transcriptional regulator, transcriptional repressor for pyruvate dehydrogenase complex
VGAPARTANASIARARVRPPVSFDPIQPLRAHEYVAEQIRRHISLRLVGPGELLPSERELAAMFGVGRPTIQHALRVLEADHLVEARRGRRGGTFVLEPSENMQALEELMSRLLRRRDELEELLGFRRSVEPVVARIAAETRKRSDLTAVRHAIESMSRALSEPEYMRFDTEFHLAIARATHNRYLVRAIEQIRIQLNDAFSLLPESETWHRRIGGEHESIFEAVKAADADAAEAAAELHVASSDVSVRALLSAIGRRLGARGA